MTGGSGGSLSHTFAQALRADKVSWLLTLSDLANLCVYRLIPQPKADVHWCCFGPVAAVQQTKLSRRST